MAGFPCCGNEIKFLIKHPVCFEALSLRNEAPTPKFCKVQRAPLESIHLFLLVSLTETPYRALAAAITESVTICQNPTTF